MLMCDHGQRLAVTRIGIDQLDEFATSVSKCGGSGALFLTEAAVLTGLVPLELDFQIDIRALFEGCSFGTPFGTGRHERGAECND